MIYAFLDCELDEPRRSVHRAGQPVALQPKVFDLLVYLIRHSARVVPKEELLRALWPGQIVGDAALSRCVMLARQVIGDTGGSMRAIRTFHRHGFRFVAPVLISEEQLDSSRPRWRDSGSETRPYGAPTPAR